MKFLLTLENTAMWDKNLQVKKVDVNEQNNEAVGFYLHLGFHQTGRSELDSMGKPFPLLNLELKDDTYCAP